MKLLYKIIMILFAVFIVSCEEEAPNNNSSFSPDLDSSLDDSSLSNGFTGNIDEYFYDLSESNLNAQFYRYSGLSIIEGLAFDPENDTLNLKLISDYVLELDPEELTTDMITIEPFDETMEGECEVISPDCPDLNDDGQLTGGEFDSLFSVEELLFSHTYTDVIKLEWDDDNQRYMVASIVGNQSPLTHKHYIGHPDSLYGNDEMPPDTEDIYDSLVYITEINYNDLNGFYFDNNGNPNFPDSLSGQYYFDQSQLVANDSIYIEGSETISHTFTFDKKVIAPDSLMFKESTDCNDDGQWTDAETEDIGNGIWDPSEPYLDDNEDGTYDAGEPFLDRNCNGVWDDAEPLDVELEECEGIVELFDSGGDETWCDMGNGQIDVAEVCADGSNNCSWEQLYLMSDRPNILIASYEEDEWTVFENIDTLTTIIPRWSESTSFQLITSINDSSTKLKEVLLRDKVETIFSYQFIENTWGYDNNYTILKSAWMENERYSNYHLFRKDDQGNIVQLIHDSYLTLLGSTPGSGIDGGTFGDYLIFDEFPMEQTYLYTYNGLLRDGEIHETFRQGYSAETFATYDIYETYEVARDSLYIPLPNGPEEDTFLNDVFKITRTKKSIMIGPGLELTERNSIWLAKDYGIVRDEMDFQFNSPDDFDGYYRLEMVDCRHCEGSTSSRSSIFDNRIEVDFENLNLVDESNDSYIKSRSYGIQTIPYNKQDWNNNQ